MNERIKKLLRPFISPTIRQVLWDVLPKFYLVNTYILSNPEYSIQLPEIDDKYKITDSVHEIIKFQKFEMHNNSKDNTTYSELRLKTGAWIPLSVMDITNGEIAYLAWIIIKSIPYIEDFGIYLHEGDFLLKDGVCLPQYRHQGLHTRMELERINYCVRRNANNIYIQIHDSNKKGVLSVLNNGYKLCKKNLVIQWPIFGVFRSVKGFLKNPLRKVVI